MYYMYVRRYTTYSCPPRSMHIWLSTQLVDCYVSSQKLDGIYIMYKTRARTLKLFWLIISAYFRHGCLRHSPRRFVVVVDILLMEGNCSINFFFWPISETVITSLIYLQPKSLIFHHARNQNMMPDAIIIQEKLCLMHKKSSGFVFCCFLIGEF